MLLYTQIVGSCEESEQGTRNESWADGGNIDECHPELENFCLANATNQCVSPLYWPRVRTGGSPTSAGFGASCQGFPAVEIFFWASVANGARCCTRGCQARASRSITLNLLPQFFVIRLHSFVPVRPSRFFFLYFLITFPEPQTEVHRGEHGAR